MHGIISISVVGAAAGIVFFIQQDISRRVAMVHEKLLFLRAIEERQAVFIQLSNDYKRLLPLFPAVYSIIPYGEHIIMFADTMEAVAKETGNKIEFQFAAEEPSVDPFVAALANAHFTATVEGTGESFNLFLKRLNSFRYLHSIDAIRIEGVNGIYGQVTVHIHGTVFIQKTAHNT